MSNDILRIGNCSGFYGDRLSAAREMVEGGPIDVLTGDYLAELTMMILFKDRMKNPEAGFARTFLRQMEEVLGTCVQRGTKVVVNAGASEVFACATQPILSDPACERLNHSTIKEFVTTNTIPLKAKAQAELPRIKVISVGQLIAEAIRRIHNEESVSSLFS